MVKHNIQKPRKASGKLFGVFSYYETLAFFIWTEDLCEGSIIYCRSMLKKSEFGPIGSQMTIGYDL
jgi:hypothetical protein